MTQGLDVSSHQGDPATWDPAAIKAAGYGFVFVKATEGAGYRNPSFPLAVKRLRAAGIVVGAYHWISAKSDPAAQIANAVAYIGKQIGPGDLPVALDFEEAGATHQQLDECRRLLRAAGHRTMTYTYPDFWSRIGSPHCTECAADRLWWASYQSVMRPPPAPWHAVSVWQYAGTAVTVPGLPGRQDANRLPPGVTLASLLTPLAAPVPPHVVTPPAPTPVPAPAAPTEDPMYIAIDPDTKGYFLIAGGRAVPIGNLADLAEWRRVGLPEVKLGRQSLDALAK